MANTFTQLAYHIVFSTKNRTPVLVESGRDELFRYFWGIHKSLKCHLYRIGGVEDHVHILTSMPTTLSLAAYVQEIKTGTSAWIKASGMFPGWEGWQDGYGAFTVSASHRDGVIEYIKNQPEHHRTESFLEEYRDCCGRPELALMNGTWCDVAATRLNALCRTNRGLCFAPPTATHRVGAPPLLA